MRRKAFLFPLILLWLALYSHAQLWSGVVSSSRAVDWSRAGIPGGIPSRTVQCGSTIAPYTGSAATINNAIAACPNDGTHFVSLGAGTFNLSSGIDFSQNNITVRGQGANNTFLVFTGSAICNGITGDVCMAGSNSGIGNEDNVCDWTAGYSRGTTTVITLANCGTTAPGHGSLGNLHVGSVLFLDQVDELTDTGTIWNCAETTWNNAPGAAVCAQTIQGGGARTDGPSVNGEKQRSQQQGVVVQAINGNQITISPALYMPNWRSGQAPQAFYASTYISNDGIEDVTLDNTKTTAGHAITIVNCYQCWVKGVRSLFAGRSHVSVWECSHCVVRDSYFYQNISHASVSYGIELLSAFDSLIENNILQQVTDSTPSCTGACSGNVAAYNLGIDTQFVSNGWFQASYYQHASGDNLNLWEGNIGTGYNADIVHGTHHFETLFRNYLTGWQSLCNGVPCNNQTVAILLAAGSRYFNIIGNVLGHSGYHNNYTCSAVSTPSCANGPTSIYDIGNTGAVGNQDTSINGFCLQPDCSSHGDYDPQAFNYLMRWANYDTVNAAVRFVSSEVPSGISPYGSPVPASQALPASFYLTSKPSWWGSMPWPAMGPDVTGGSIANVGGHANMNPAMACYTNVMGGPADGSGNVLMFNADNCYAAGNPSPAPPTGLTSAVH